MIYEVKRLFKVDNKKPFRILLSVLLRRRSIRSLTASSQERNFLNPNWESESRSFSARKLYNEV